MNKINFHQENTQFLQSSSNNEWCNEIAVLLASVHFKYICENIGLQLH